MGDYPRETAVHNFDGPVRLDNPLTAAQIAALAGIRRRKALTQSALWRDLAAAVRQVTFGVAHQPEPGGGQEAREFVRVVAWNIQRGIALEGIIAYLQSQPLLAGADVYLFNEVDLGMARTGNRDIAAELASALGCGYVFGNSYLCLDHGDTRDGRPDGSNTLSMHGNAILSRWPIRRAENFSLAVSKDKFHSSEKRLGHKKALWAEIETPLGPLPVVAAHLDSIASPAQRTAQMGDIVRKVAQRGLDQRVLIGGDFNTCTYDVASVPRLVWNITKKLFRGGFPHAMHHYLHPQQLYERSLFELFAAFGYQVDLFNVAAEGTTRYVVGTFESESKVSDHLPQFAVSLLRRKLRPWNGVAALKLDWFCGRGVQSFDSVGPSDDPLRAQPPRVFVAPTWREQSLSDHDPIMVDITF